METDLIGVFALIYERSDASREVPTHFVASAALPNSTVGEELIEVL